MDCKIQKVEVCYIKDTDFIDLELNITTTAVITNLSFELKQYSGNTIILNELNEGIRLFNDKIYIVGNSLEVLKSGTTEGYLFADLNGLRTLLFISEINISNKGCNCIEPINITVVNESNTLNITISQVVNNWGVTQDISGKVDKVGVDDIEITDFSKGVVFKTADSSRWRMTLDNDGRLTSNKIV